MRSVMFTRSLLAIMLLLALWVLPGCGEKDQSKDKPATVSKEGVKKEAKEAYDTTKAYTQEQMQAFREKAETRLAEYEKEIDELQAKAEKLGRGCEGESRTTADGVASKTGRGV